MNYSQINYTETVDTYYSTCGKRAVVFLQARDKPEMRIFLAIITCIAFFGIVGNILNILIFFRKKSSYSQLSGLLIGLAFSDLIICIVVILVVVVPQFLLASGIPFKHTEMSFRTILDMKLSVMFLFHASKSRF
jgi:uncharacterized membrane protein